MVRNVTSTWRSGAALALVWLGSAACSSSAEQARETAVSAVRTDAIELREQFAEAAQGRSGRTQLDAVRTVLPDVPLVAAAAGDGVVVTGALTARGESGGGLTYEQFVARLCLRYLVHPGSGDTVVGDAPCPPDVGTQVPADATVLLAD